MKFLPMQKRLISLMPRLLPLPMLKQKRLNGMMPLLPQQGRKMMLMARMPKWMAQRSLEQG